MGLYSSFSTADYYDDEPAQKKVSQPQATTQSASAPTERKLDVDVKKSLYDQAQDVATAKENYKGPDFRTTYRVGQKVAIQGPNGAFRTKNGAIAEIVAENLMYVYMEDTYKDSTDQWLADFVTDHDTIHLI